MIQLSPVSATSKVQGRCGVQSSRWVKASELGL